MNLDQSTLEQITNLLTPAALEHVPEGSLVEAVVINGFMLSQRAASFFVIMMSLILRS